MSKEEATTIFKLSVTEISQNLHLANYNFAWTAEKLRRLYDASLDLGIWNYTCRLGLKIVAFSFQDKKVIFYNEFTNRKPRVTVS